MYRLFEIALHIPLHIAGFYPANELNHIKNK